MPNNLFNITELSAISLGDLDRISNKLFPKLSYDLNVCTCSYYTVTFLYLFKQSYLTMAIVEAINKGNVINSKLFSNSLLSK